MQWLRNNLAPEEGVLVAAMPAFDTVKPIDAGAWIPALTGHPIQFWPFDFDWTGPDAKTEVCAPGPRYVYAGSTEVVFAREQLEYLSWAEVVFRENRVTIYRLDCP